MEILENMTVDVDDFYAANMRQRNRWDERWLTMARMVSIWSKDPNTQVGAVIADTLKGQPVAVGFNGFPRLICDDHRLNDRPLKNRLTVHAEINALISAGRRVDGMTIYTTKPPCPQCAAAIINAGIRRVVFQSDRDLLARWGAEGLEMLAEAGLDLLEIPNE